MKAKEIVGLDCGASAAEGIRLVLRSRLEEMCAFRAAALDWSDMEGVHDMRVASRRLRSLVRDFSPYFRHRKLRRTKSVLKSIADALGAVRDQDVTLKALEKLAAEAPAEVAAGIERFANERRLKQERARSCLEEALTEAALDKLQKEFNGALEDGLRVSRNRKNDRDEQPSAESMSFRQAGRERLLAGLQELQDLSASLYRPLKTKPLHQMRLASKRLRYALELFAPCWGEPLAPFAKEIAKLQTTLGELHDCDVWIGDIGKALQSGGEPESEQERNAALWLLDYFVGERTDRFRSALARWHEWETNHFQLRLADTINDQLPPVAAADLDSGG
jgi:CHAD domain-containing protein